MKLEDGGLETNIKATVLVSHLGMGMLRTFEMQR